MRFALGLAASLMMAAPALAQDAGTTASTEIDPQAYAGIWYEIARTPAPFQEMCAGGVTATYELVGAGTVKVTNRCDGEDGQPQGITGEAEVVSNNFNTLNVEFSMGEQNQGVNYVVAAASDIKDGKYQWAAVQSPEGPIGWILAREPQIDAETRSQAEAALKEAGIEIPYPQHDLHFRDPLVVRVEPARGRAPGRNGGAVAGTQAPR